MLYFLISESELKKLEEIKISNLFNLFNLSNEEKILIKNILLLDDEKLNNQILKKEIINFENFENDLTNIFSNNENNKTIYKILITDKIYKRFKTDNYTKHVNDLYLKVEHNILINYTNLTINIINFLSKLIYIKPIMNYNNEEISNNYCDLIINNSFVEYMLMYSYYKWEDLKLFHGLKNIDESTINFDNNLTNIEKKLFIESENIMFDDKINDYDKINLIDEYDYELKCERKKKYRKKYNHLNSIVTKIISRENLNQ